MLITSIITRCSFLRACISSVPSSSLINLAGDEQQSSPMDQALSSLVRGRDEQEQDDDHQTLGEASSLFRKSISDYLCEEDPTMAGSLLRLAFHDAATREDHEGSTDNTLSSFTGGPNGSIRFETEWNENRGISRPLKVVDKIYKDMKLRLGADQVMSFADCISLAGSEAVAFADGPKIPIKLGRIDATQADPKIRRKILQSQTDRSIVGTTLPSAGLDSDGLRLYFGALGLSSKEFVALCGAHDLGRHVSLLGMSKACLKNLTRQCLEDAPVLLPFVAEEPDKFSNTYYKKLLKWYDRKVVLGEVAFIPTDVDLVMDGGLRKFVQQFARDKAEFYETFIVAYQKLVDPGATSIQRY